MLTQPGSTGVGEVPESSWYTVAVLPRNCVELLSRSFLRQPILRCVLPTLSKVTFTKTALFAPALQVEEALTIKNTDIAKELCLPPVKLHCSMLAEDAIKAALADYKLKQESKKEEPEKQ